MIRITYLSLSLQVFFRSKMKNNVKEKEFLVHFCRIEVQVVRLETKQHQTFKSVLMSLRRFTHTSKSHIS